MLSELSQLKKGKYYKFPLISQRQKQKEFGEEGNGKLMFNQQRVSLLQDGKFWGWMVVMVANKMNVFNATELHI